MTTPDAAAADFAATRFGADFTVDLAEDFFDGFFAAFDLGKARFDAPGLRALAFLAAALLPRDFFTRALRAKALVLPARFCTRRACRFVEAIVDLPV
jgi:hypothetical protein